MNRQNNKTEYSLNDKRTKYSLCENFDNNKDICILNMITECSKNDFEQCQNCKDFLVKSNLVFF